MTVTNLRLRVLSGILLSFIWIAANVALGTTAAAENASTFSEAFRFRAHSSPSPIEVAPETTLPPPENTIPIASPVEAVTSEAIPVPSPSHLSLHDSRRYTQAMIAFQRVIATPEKSEYANSMTGQQYRYFERSQDVTALQMELGMRSVDGVYGPETRKAHIEALGGPTAVLYRNYPEFGQTPTPCSHGCEPGDGHYELPTLGELINEYFLPEDRVLARMIAFCESSGQTHHTGSEVVSVALAVGWFQHLAKYWQERSTRAGFEHYDPFNGRANVGVAAWLFYSSGVHHWNPSKACWGKT